MPSAIARRHRNPLSDPLCLLCQRDRRLCERHDLRLRQFCRLLAHRHGAGVVGRVWRGVR